MLQLGGDKMSKSIGNLVSITELIDQNRTAAFRLLVLQSHYRAPLTYLPEGLEAANRGLDRIRAALRGSESNSGQSEPFEAALIDETVSAFQAAMDDDFDTPKAVAALFGLARAINRSTGGASSADLDRARATLRELLTVLGIDPDQDVEDGAGDAAPFIELLLTIRERLRSAKQWNEADAIRIGLSELGISIADGPEGTSWRKET